jgi:hypothetical protein
VVAAAEEAGHDAMRTSERAAHRDALLTRSVVAREGEQTRETLRDAQREIVETVTDAIQRETASRAIPLCQCRVRRS